MIKHDRFEYSFNIGLMCKVECTKHVTSNVMFPDVVTAANAREATRADHLRVVHEDVYVTTDHEMPSYVLQTLPGEPRQTKRRRRRTGLGMSTMQTVHSAE